MTRELFASLLLDDGFVLGTLRCSDRAYSRPNRTPGHGSQIRFTSHQTCWYQFAPVKPSLLSEYTLPEVPARTLFPTENWASRSTVRQLIVLRMPLVSQPTLPASMLTNCAYCAVVTPVGALIAAPPDNPLKRSA